jgi:Tat protein translocase TatB subunit
MFGIGVSELAVIVIIALVVIGPNQIPELARSLGKMFAQFKRTTNGLRDQVDQEMRQFTETEEVKEFKNAVESELRTVESATTEFVQHHIAEGERELKAEEEQNTSAAATPAESATADSVSFAKSAPPDGKLPS